MEFGMFHQFPALPGRPQRDAFEEGFAQIDAAERWGLGAGADGVGRREGEGVADGSVPAGHGVFDRTAEKGGDRGDRAWAVLRVKIAVDGVDAEGEFEAGFLLPPLADVEDQAEAGIGEGELAFVDDQAGIGIAAGDGGDDLVEGEFDEGRRTEG